MVNKELILKQVEDINRRIRFCTDDHLRHDRAIIYIKQNEYEIRHLHDELKIMRPILAKEKRDVEILENRSVTSLFYAILGSIEKQLEIERQEYLIEALKYNEILESLEILKFETDVLRRNLKDEEHHKELDDLLHQKEELLRKIDKKFSIKMTIYDQDISRISQKVESIKIAMDLGNEIKHSLKDIMRHLEKVKAWGKWEYYTGKSHVSNTKKRDIDAARTAAVRTNLKLKNFEEMLHKIFPIDDLPESLRIDTFSNFLNQLYENLITDWIIKRQIRNTHINLETVLDKVNLMLANLNKEKEEMQDQVQSLLEVRQELIIKA